jgi:phosphohistidine swiveling domain-containing protein
MSATATGSAPAPTPIPVSPDFPFEWENTEDARRFWEREVMHAPGQFTVLDEDLAVLATMSGFNYGGDYYDLPVRDKYSRINTWLYQSIEPVSHDPAELERLGRTAMENMAATFGRQLENWQNESLPELEQMYAVWDAFDLAGATDEEFAAHLDRTVEMLVRAWQIHFRTVFPMLIGVSLFHDLHGELLGSEDGFDSMRLLQGLPNRSTESDAALLTLARKAREDDDVRAAIEKSGDARSALSGSESGRAFLAELDEYIERYGKRLRLYMTFSEPSYAEDPTPVVSTLREALDGRDELPLEELAAERERLIAEARTKVTELPEALREQFELLLKTAQEGAILQEDHNFAIDGRVNYEVRRVLLEAGRRLAAAGTIDSPESVFHVRLAELREALRVPADLAALVADRKAEIERWASVVPPPVLGTLPPGPPPDDPIGRAVGRLFGGVPPTAPDATVVTGMAGSAGVARGVARVIHSLGDADRLRNEEVLVTETTAPPWTPLFARAAAIVTDAGGILSHCAVVAREYEIPAVVGTKIGTMAIRDGQLVEVDGTNGTVRLLSRE